MPGVNAPEIAGGGVAQHIGHHGHHDFFGLPDHPRKHRDNAIKHLADICTHTVREPLGDALHIGNNPRFFLFGELFGKHTDRNSGNRPVA